MIRVRWDTNEGSLHCPITQDVVQAIIDGGIDEAFNPQWEQTIYDLLMAGF